MQNPKKPTRKEKIYLRSLRLNSDNWLISKRTVDYWLIIHRISGRTRKIPPL